MRIEQPYGKRYLGESGTCEPKYKYFIACEGKITEYKYFKGVSIFREELGIKPIVKIIYFTHDKSTDSHPLKIIKDVSKEIKNEPDIYFPKTDKICIIVDRDKKSFFLRQYKKAMKLCKKKNYNLYVSNPCFELWLLFHYSDLAQYDLKKILDNKKIGKRTQVELYLKDDFLNGSYSKKNIKFEKNYKNFIDDAIKNAQKYELSTKKLINKVGSNVGQLLLEMKSINKITN